MTASFPSRAPTSRNYELGDWPVRKFQAQDGAEVRILYGNRRVGATLSLTYENIEDELAEDFADHYYAHQGTYKTFVLPQAIPANSVGKGWSGRSNFYNAGVGARWRYDGPPQIRSVRPGISSVSITLKTAGQP